MKLNMKINRRDHDCVAEAHEGGPFVSRSTYPSAPSVLGRHPTSFERLNS